MLEVWPAWLAGPVPGDGPIAVRSGTSFYRYPLHPVGLIILHLRQRTLIEQDAELSQTDRAMLHVTEYVDKSFKVTQGH